MREVDDTTPQGSPEARLAALEAELAGERALTREVDHRAKNSLQLVSSLLLLASRRSATDEARQVLRSMHLRVGAVAAAHRNLLVAGSTERFDLTQLTQELAGSLAQTQGAAIRLSLEAVEVEPAAAPPLALMMNELLMNALTHAGRDGQPPEVSVQLDKTPDGFALAVQDDGPGPEAAQTAGFGLMMVRLLAQQLGARFAMEDAQPGLRAVVRRP
jgi:two-component sensor histidine kinase